MELRERLGHQERTAGEQAARCRVLEEQLARLDGLGDALRTAQEAVREGLDREAQLRFALDEATRRKSADEAARPSKKKGSTRTKTASES